MQPFVREYINDINAFISQGVDQENFYVLSHDDERTKRILDDVNANTIGLKDMEFGNAISSIFQKKGDELRNKLQNIGFSESESEVLEEDMDQGKVLLIFTNEHDPGKLLL